MLRLFAESIASSRCEQYILFFPERGEGLRRPLLISFSSMPGQLAFACSCGATSILVGGRCARCYRRRWTDQHLVNGLREAALKARSRMPGLRCFGRSHRAPSPPRCYTLPVLSSSYPPVAHFALLGEPVHAHALERSESGNAGAIAVVDE
jgi:hypothetical protein